MSKSKKIFFLVPYPLMQAPSQRFRFEQYFEFLSQNNIQFQVQSFIDIDTWNILYKPGYFFQKTIGILKGFIRRGIKIPVMLSYDFIFIHREASPIGPPIFEWMLGKVFRKKIIFDFDDAIWLANTSENNKIMAAFKFHNKTSSICRWSYKVSCGNRYLANYALKFNSNVIVNPTTIDTINLHNTINSNKNELPVIGWTGTHSTIEYLNFVIPILKKLEANYLFKFIVISNRKPDFELDSMIFIPWNKETEIEDLNKINIGIMPLKNDQWSEGKCGFKGLQYMALSIAAIMSPVGVNKEIIDDGHNGFLAETETQWLEKLTLLITDANLRIQLGKEGRKTIENKYSVVCNQQNFLSLFNE